MWFFKDEFHTLRYFLRGDSIAWRCFSTRVKRVKRARIRDARHISSREATFERARLFRRLQVVYYTWPSWTNQTQFTGSWWTIWRLTEETFKPKGSHVSFHEAFPYKTPTNPHPNNFCLSYIAVVLYGRFVIFLKLLMQSKAVERKK